jgi:hypothetical protein
MALTSLPNNVEVLNFKNNFNNTVNKTFSGKTVVTDFGNSFWSFTLQTPPMRQYDFYDSYSSFFMSTTGKVSDIRLPIINDASGTASGTIQVVNDSSIDPAYNLNVGSKNIPVQNGSGTLKAGDIISFSNHKKVYMITEDLDLDGSSVDVMKITPGLVRSVAPADGSTLVTVNYDNVGIQAIAENDVQQLDYGIEELVTYSQDFREVL